MRRGLAGWLRQAANRIDPDPCPRCGRLVDADSVIVHRAGVAVRQWHQDCWVQTADAIRPTPQTSGYAARPIHVTHNRVDGRTPTDEETASDGRVLDIK